MSIGERYVELCLRLARHDEELMDFYFGPEELAERVERRFRRQLTEQLAPAELLA